MELMVGFLCTVKMRCFCNRSCIFECCKNVVILALGYLRVKNCSLANRRSILYAVKKH
jgi:hypothetical protein